MLKYWIISGISLISILGITLLGMGIYENQNSCRFGADSNPGSQFKPDETTLGKIQNVLSFTCFPMYEGGYDSGGYGSGPVSFKPLILLYPQESMDVEVQLDYSPGFFATFPEYNDALGGWSVLAHPDGTLYDKNTQQDTYGLFWEGYGYSDWDMSEGFVVRGSDIRDFLYEKLTDIGLNTKEKSDFIMFWYPKLQDYKYIQITFAGEEYSERARLNITPKPDSLLRVFMVAKPLGEKISIPEQKLESFQRKGFSVVEWGGTIIE